MELSHHEGGGLLPQQRQALNNKRHISGIEVISCSPKKRHRMETTCAQESTTTRVIQANACETEALQIIEAIATKIESRRCVNSMTRKWNLAVSVGKVNSGGWYQGYRLINGKRIEIKVLGEIMQTLFEKDLLLKLIAYAEKRAKCDDRVSGMHGSPSQDTFFSEWSMIVSQPGCKAQTIHTDVPSNNIQFGLIMQDESPGTVVLPDSNHGPVSISQLEHILEEDGAPKALIRCLESTPEIKSQVLKLLHAYGPLLNSRANLDASMVGAEQLASKGVLKRGDLICTQGGIPHAGPACTNGIRAVMFASASPSPDDLYDVDDQYFAHSAWLFLIQIMWNQCDSSSKEWFLRKLSSVVKEYDCSVIENHDYMSALFVDFMRDVASCRRKEVDPKTIRAFLAVNEAKPASELFSYEPPAIFKQ